MIKNREGNKMKNKSLFGMIDVHLLGKQVDWFWI
jgi:hypothetical protein